MQEGGSAGAGVRRILAGAGHMIPDVQAALGGLPDPTHPAGQLPGDRLSLEYDT